MLAKAALVITALVLASETVVAVSTGGAGLSHKAHARTHRRRAALQGFSTNNNTTNPCKREDNNTTSADKAAKWNFKVVNPNTNLTIVAVDRKNPKTSRQPLQETTDRQALADTSSAVPSTEQSTSWIAPSSSSEWSSQWSSTSAAPSATVVAGFGNKKSGMSAVNSWSGKEFEDWDFFNHADPTHGSVSYITRDDAKSSNLVGLDDQGRFKMSVDTGSLIGGLRKSVRISSPANWKKNQLVVADIAHMPQGCGTWPAFWSIGAKRSWPAGGEIDILEGVNDVSGNAYTLHTTPGCMLTGQSGASSLSLVEDCQYQPGCSYKDKDADSFGPTFNTAGGGVYASYFSDEGIKIWFWSAVDVPSSIRSGSPDMSEFGTPKANFGSSRCDMDTFFDDEQMLIINTTLMGDWAGATFWQNGCTGTLADALLHGDNFNQAYWLINSVKIYQ